MATQSELNICEPMEMTDSMEENLAISSSNVQDTLFDNIIGIIEDIIMEDDFQKIQKEFMDKYWTEFEDSEENKFIYTDIHKEYVDLVEKYIENNLLAKIPGFNMGDFSKQLESRREELDGEVFEMLLTFSDFVAFKELFLDYRAEKEGRSLDFSDLITSHSYCAESELCHNPADPLTLLPSANQ